MTFPESPRARRSANGTLGTFGGVFTPSVLTILGIILFLRLGWIVGSAGLGRALLIIGLAHAVSVLTALSLAAIATSRKVRGGGDYFLISRTLGVEYGGALGLVLFLAQSVAVAFYCFGFGEALVSVLPADAGLAPRHVAAGAALLLLLIVLVGADLATRFQYAIMAVIGAGLLSFFAGAGFDWEAGRLAEGWIAEAEPVPFWVLFAIFFPAVTGFTQGVSLSGDLKDPARSLPLGTFAAVGLSLVVYTAAALAFAGAQPLEVLRSDYLGMERASLVPQLVLAGVIAAALSSALASFLGAPRILQAMAADGVFPWIRPFARGHGPTRNPRRGVVFTAGIALAGIALGDLNAIAPVISMFLLISYALLNYATYVEARGASPSFRPRFRFFHAYASLAGTACCVGVMLAIDPFAGVLALAVVAATYQYLKRTAVPVRFADSRRAYSFRRLKETLHDLSRQPESEWTWQPHVMAVSQDPERRDLLIRFAGWVSGTSGVTTAVEILEGEADFEGARETRQQVLERLTAEIREQKLDAFPLVVTAPSRRVGVASLLQSWGAGPLRANTVLTDWLRGENDSDPLRYGRELLSMVRLGCNVLVLDVEGREWRRVQALEPEERRIDVWWREDAASRLALLLAYLMTRAEAFEDAPIRVLTTCPEDQLEKIRSHLVGLIDEARIEAEIECVVEGEGAETLERSREAAVVFLPIRVEGMKLASEWGDPVEAVLEKLPVAFLVAAARDVQLTQEEPEAEAAPDEASAEADRAGNSSRNSST